MDCGYTDQLFLFRRRFARLAPHLVLEWLSQSQLVCDIKSQCVKSSPMRFIFGWIAVLCLGADALRATLKENWQDKLICECKEVKSVKDCPDYKKKEGGFPPSFPRFYHHEVQTSTKYVNYCCGFTSSDLKKSWWQRKKIQKEKEMCLVERRPFQSRRCCHLTPIRGNMGALPLMIKSAKAYSGAHPAIAKIQGKKLEDLKFDDYKLKSPVFVEWQDIAWIDGDDDRDHLSKDETIDVLTDFQKRFSGLENFESERNFTLMCKEGLNQLDAVSSENQCTKNDRLGTCCCPENGVLKAGENVCLEVDGAPKKQTYTFNPIKEKAVGRRYVEDWKFVFVSAWEVGFAENAPNWLEVTDPESQGQIRYKKRSNQISSNNKCAGWTTKQIGRMGQKRDKKYCTKMEVKLQCPAGQVLYETVPGSKLTNREYACKAGLKNNVRGDPDFASKCYCQ